MPAPRRSRIEVWLLFTFVIFGLLMAPLPSLSNMAIAAKDNVPLFDRADLNKDGYIDISEAGFFPALRRSFGRADFNGDNRIDKVEFARAF